METSLILAAINAKTEDTPGKSLKAIKDGENINLTDDDGNSFLHVIADRYTEDCVDAPYLIPIVFQLSNAGIARNVKNQDGDTCLHIAAKKYGVQQLLRAFIMIGVDPKIENGDKKDVKALVDISETDMNMCLELLWPGLWHAAAQADDDLVLRLVGSWCNTEELRDGKPVMNLVHINLSDRTASTVEKTSNTLTLVHAALAGDKRMVKKAIKAENVDVNTSNSTHIGYNGSVFFMPLVGEVALLHNTECMIKLLKAGADVNFIVDETGCNEPLFLYILRLLPAAEEAYDVLEEMLPFADFSLVENKTHMVCKIAFEKRLPFTIVKIMISKGFNLFECDTNGLTLRDRIFLANYKESRESLRIRLGFVDQAIVDMALEGDIQTLEQLTLSCYDYDQVVSRKGQTMMEAVAERGNENVLRFLEGLPELQRTIRRVHVAVETGNLPEIKQHMTRRLAESCDKGGRGLLHKAVLFERRFIIKYFLKEFPSMVHMRDSMGRTPVHWAACLTDGKDIEDSLLKAGANLIVKDKKGKTPEDYRKQMGTMQEILKVERTRDYGIDVYLLQRYMEFKFAIESGDLIKVEEVRNGMYKDISLNDVPVKMYQTTPPPRDLLSLCIDNTEDRIGKFLLSQGIDWDIKYTDMDGSSMSLEKAAEKKEMKQTVEAIQYQKSRAAEEKKILNKVKKEKKELLEKQKKDGTYEAINLAKIDQTCRQNQPKNDYNKVANSTEKNMLSSNGTVIPGSTNGNAPDTTSNKSNNIENTNKSNDVKLDNNEKKPKRKSCTCALF